MYSDLIMNARKRNVLYNQSLSTKYTQGVNKMAIEMPQGYPRCIVQCKINLKLIKNRNIFTITHNKQFFN